MKTLYIAGDSFLHRLHPLTKTIHAIALIVVQSVWNINVATVTLIVLNMLLLIWAGVFKQTLSLLKFLGFLLFTMLIIQGLVNPANQTPIFSIGSLVFYQEGVLSVLKTGLNIVNIILSFSILIVTTKPSDMIEASITMGLNPRIGYVFASVFQIVPEMLSTVDTITDAQRSRGLQTEGNLLTRAKAFVPLLGPVVMSSFVGIRERSMALEVRGFSAETKKTFLNDLQPTLTDKTLMIVLLGLSLLLILTKILLSLRGGA